MATDSKLSSFLTRGTAAARPVTPNIPANTIVFYEATDTGALSYYGSAWNGIGLSGSTTNLATFAASGGASPGGTFNGSVAITVDFSTVGAFRQRTLTGTANEITVSNGDGTSGNPTFSLPSALTFSGKTITGGSITPETTPTTTAPGYLGAPVLTGLDSGNVAPALTDCGKTFYHTDANARNFTIPANASVAFPIGTILTIEQGPSAAAVSISITTDTLYWGSSTGTRSLAANGGCTIQKLDSTHWRLRGDGIT